MSPSAMAPERRHTLFFLREIRSFAPVFLDTEVDMTSVSREREATRADGHRYSLLAYVIYAAARALALHPEANAAVQGRIRPRVARYQGVNVKFTLDKTVNGQRVVLSALIPGADEAGIAEIQRQLEYYRDGDPATLPEFAGIRALHRLPAWLGSTAYRWRVRSLTKRQEILGTLAVTSLGHRPVDGFHSVGGTTITLGVGRVHQRPVAVDGQVLVAPVMRLNLAFDHRVIDGAEAADLLGDIKQGLEELGAAPVTPAAADRASGVGALGTE